MTPSPKSVLSFWPAVLDCLPATEVLHLNQSLPHKLTHAHSHAEKNMGGFGELTLLHPKPLCFFVQKARSRCETRSPDGKVNGVLMLDYS